MGEKLSERVGCRGKSPWHTNTGRRELADQFAERGIFSPYGRNIGHPAL
jgi:hypothetical protein